MGKSAGRVDIVNKEGDVNLAVLAGQLHQVAKDAIAKEMKRICESFCYDESYWKCNLALEVSELGHEFEKLNTIIISDSIEEEHKCNCKESTFDSALNEGMHYGT